MKITYPHLGNSYIAMEALIEGMGHEAITPPMGNKRTLEWGSSLSPEQTCLPFKIILGNMLEGLSQGAEAVLMIGGWGPCRLGYYAEIQRILLAEMGQKIEFFTLETPRGHYGETWRTLRRTFSNTNARKFWHGCQLAWVKLEALETLENRALFVRPREKVPGSTSRLLGQQIRVIKKAHSIKAVRQGCLDCEVGFRDLMKRSSNDQIIRVGVVGEIYTVVEPFANLNLEERLGHLGVEVVRTISLRSWVQDHVFKKLIGLSHVKPLVQSARGYLRGFIGGHGLESVARSVDLALADLEGIIHILPLSCMPEVVAQAILPKVSSDYNVPIMSLVVDEHSSETGFQTRLEAFVDLMERRLYAHV